jgi:hypothetical protein
MLGYEFDHVPLLRYWRVLVVRVHEDDLLRGVERWAAGSR